MCEWYMCLSNAVYWNILWTWYVILFFLIFKIFCCLLVNPCSNQICWNGGTCTVNANATSVSFKCTCSSLYTGQYCESSIYTQALLAVNCILPCVNGGSCSNGICVCTSQYTGPLCQYSK